jgi:hypothetical protein
MYPLLRLGDACRPTDLQRALTISRAEFVVLCIETATVKKSDICTASAQALAQVLKLLHPRPHVVSGTGAETLASLLWRPGCLLSPTSHSRHTGQEEVYSSAPP